MTGVQTCALPILVITDLGVFIIDKHKPGTHRHDPAGMTLVELAPGVSLDEIKAKTQASYRVGKSLQ